MQIALLNYTTNKMLHTALPKGWSSGDCTKMRVNFECEISNLMVFLVVTVVWPFFDMMR